MNGMIKAGIKTFFLFIFINQLYLGVGFSQEALFHNIVCVRNPEVTYSVYQPESFSHGKMIYILDPAGRSDLAISKFKLLADHLNIMLICSKNSKNGPIDINLSVFNAVMTDSKQRYSYDSSDVILSGFSGGSRAAFRISTIHSNMINAVIGCGAGLPSNMKISDDPGFQYVGITGITDMNFYEMLDLDIQIKKRSNRSGIFFFHGGHAWPPDSLLLLAAEWINITDDNNKSDGGDLLNLFREIYDQNGQNFESWVKAYQLERFAELLGDDGEKKAITEELLAIQEDQSFEKSSRSFHNYWDTFNEARNEMEEEIGKIRYSNFPDITLKPISWWITKIQMINGSIKSRSLEKKNMGLRLQDFLWRNCFEQGAISYNESQYLPVIKYDDIMKQVHPESYIPWIRSAHCHLKLGDQTMALKNLKHAIDRGFSNREYLEKNFDTLSSEKEYQKILKDLNK
jgi:hypothetical protein